MIQTSKKTNKTKIDPQIKNTLILGTVALFIHIFVVMMICVILFILDIDVFSNYPIIIVTLSISFFLSAYVVGMKIRKRGMIVGLIYNLIPLLVYLIASLLLNSFSFDFRLFVIITVYMLMSSAGGITAVNSKLSKKRKR